MDISGMTDIPAKSILIFWFKRWNLGLQLYHHVGKITKNVSFEFSHHYDNMFVSESVGEKWDYFVNF